MASCKLINAADYKDCKYCKYCIVLSTVDMDGSSCLDVFVEETCLDKCSQDVALFGLLGALIKYLSNIDST